MKKLTTKIVLALSLMGILATANADVNLGACYGCHGKNFEKKALGKSKIVSDMNATAVATALIGYKDGSYGGPMKGLMKGQVIKYSNDELNTSISSILNTQK